MSATVHVLYEEGGWKREVRLHNRRVERLHNALGPMRGDYQSLAELASERRWYGWRGWLQPKWKRDIAAYLRKHLVDAPWGAQRAIEDAYRMLPEGWQ